MAGFGVDREGFTEIVDAYTGRTIGIAAGNLKGIKCFARPQSVEDYEYFYGSIDKYPEVDTIESFIEQGKVVTK